MANHRINKRTFFKTLGVLSAFGMLFPWFKGKKENPQINRDYPMTARRDPHAVVRTTTDS